jgi:hypothetical protein
MELMESLWFNVEPLLNYKDFLDDAYSLSDYVVIKQNKTDW